MKMQFNQRSDGLLQKKFMTAALSILAVCALARASFGAEVSCLSKYDGTSSVAPEYLAKLWPSGFRPSPGMCRVAFLRGTIEKGDYEKFRAILRPNYRTLPHVKLSSSGGDVDESIKIGKLMRKYLLMAEAPVGHDPNTDALGLPPTLSLGLPPTLSNNLFSYLAQDLCRGPDLVCASACALIWFGATTREGTVGVHRPHTNDPEFKNASPGDAANLYRQMIATVVHYLDEMEVPRAVNDLFTETNSSEIKWIYTDFDDRSLDHPPSYAEWLSASCGRLTDAEDNAYWKLVGKQTRDTNEAMLYDLLFKKRAEIERCAFFLRYSRVDQLDPP